MTRPRRRRVTPEEFIRRAPWRFAETMPHVPHEYTVRGQTLDADFELFVRHVREHGYRASFGGRVYTYLEIDGWKYWTMGAPPAETTIINRAKVEARDWLDDGEQAGRAGQ